MNAHRPRWEPGRGALALETMAVAAIVAVLAAAIAGVAVLPWPMVAGVCGLLGAMGAALAAKRILEPLRTLTEAAHRLQHGEVTSPIPAIQQPDLAPLAQSLDQARESLALRIQELTESEQRQLAILEAVPEAIITTQDGLIMSANAMAQRLTDPAAQIVGQPLNDILPGVVDPDRSSAQAPWTTAITLPSGQSLEVEVSRSLLTNQNVGVVSVYVMHDVSRYLELNRLQEQLLYHLAHELRAPVTVLNNAVDLLDEHFAEMTTDELSRLSLTARRAAERLNGLLANLLSAGSIQAGRLQIRTRQVDLHAIISSAEELVAWSIQARGQRLEVRAPATPVLVMADEEAATQVLINILSNASKYSPVGSTIEITVVVEERSVRTAVRDQGAGIPLEQQNGLFERFYRASSAGESPGVGLGLAIARGIVESHGGTIGFESSEGSGTTVWFNLPLPPSESTEP